jgi:hypothetical protein
MAENKKGGIIPVKLLILTGILTAAAMTWHKVIDAKETEMAFRGER